MPSEYKYMYIYMFVYEQTLEMRLIFGETHIILFFPSSKLSARK